MGPRLLIEAYDRRGRRIDRHRADHLPVIIGRSPACDVIVDDAFVSPEHARLERDERGEMVLVDLDSTNGVREPHGDRRVPRAVVTTGTRLCIGETTLQFRDADERVPSARRLPAHLARGPRVSALLGATLSWAVVALVSAGGEWIKQFDEFRIEPLIREVTNTSLALVLWAGLWAIGNRVVSQRFQFIDHLFVASFWAVWLIGGDVVYDYACYAFDLDDSAEVLSAVLSCGATAALLFGHLRLCSSAAVRSLIGRAVAISAAATALSSISILADSLEGPQWSVVPEFSRRLKPPAFRFAGSEDLESFLRHGAELKQRVDGLAAE